MKKLMLISFLAFLMIFSVAAAQDADTESLPNLNVSTVADIFSWSDEADDVITFLNLYDGLTFSESEEESFEKTYTASAETENERFWFVFHFDSETNKLWEIEFLSILISEEIAPSEFMEWIYDKYELADVDLYGNKSINDYIGRLDQSIVVAGPKTICAMGASDPTDETYGMLSVLFFDREYFES